MEREVPLPGRSESELELANQQLQELATELEAQTEELQATSLELEAQTEELQATTFELEQRVVELEMVARHARFAGEIGNAIIADTSLPVALQRCCQAAIDHLRAAFARVWLVDQSEPVLILVASAGCYTHLNGPHGRVPIGQFKIGTIAAEKKAHVTNSVIGDPRVPSQEWAKAEGMIAFAGYPLIVADRVVGVIAMFARETLTPEDFESFGTAAKGISLVISNARNYEAGLQARAAAEQANRSKAEFLTVMSHELRTPLNAIGGYAELIEMGLHGPVTPDQTASLQRIQRSQRHLLGLINGILNFAKVDAGVIEYEVERVSIAEVMSTCEALIVPQLRSKELAFNLIGCDADLLAMCDREKTQQILLNLLSNAVKFTDAGGTITLSCTPVDERIVTHVEDTGRGIAPHQIDRVFQPFVQLDAALTRTKEGTGLGLAISRDLARGMHGDLTVESRLGVGSTFILSLPRA
ncbi:MAG: GAF domain-containing protein [Gemmatimonadaceae bacterium]|nr:GAF domain-containing protein [Gemmatimonadaceae bacterium]